MLPPLIGDYAPSWDTICLSCGDCRLAPGQPKLLTGVVCPACGNSTQLSDGLKRLNAVGLQATTEDASRWYLTVFCPGRDPVTFLHEFHLFHGECNPEQTIDEPEPEDVDPRLTFLQPDPESGSQHPWSQFDAVAQDYADMRIPIADEFRESVAGLNYGQALIRFREYEVQRLVDVATHAGISFERSALSVRNFATMFPATTSARITGATD